MNHTSHNDYDLVVVGAGAAGLSAALTAVEESPDARVAVLERSAQDLRGGNTRWSGAYLRLEAPTTPVSTLVDYGMWASKGNARKDYYEALVAAAPEAFEWVQQRGVKLAQLPTIFVTVSAPRYQPIGGGKEIVEPLFAELEKSGADILYETSARQLVTDETGAVTGVVVCGPDGVRRVLNTRAVVLATGGFQGNPELMTRYVGRNAYRIPPISVGGGHNRGDGLLMALEAGAATDGQFDLFHAEPKDPRSSVAEAVVMTFPYGILVNKSGKRFIDEAGNTVDLTYEKVARAILEEEDSIAYALFDQKAWSLDGWEHAVKTDVPPLEAETIEELAELMGVDPSTLRATVDAYNAACPDDDSAFAVDRLDGLVAEPEGQPRKSNWSRRIEQGPFFAYPQICANVFTFGGVRTDNDARVVDSDGHPIRGLYGAGEMTGLYYEAYAGSTSVMRSITFGRIAGRNAIREANVHTDSNA
ncbi:FAD-binding protein [Tessaracoccus sp. OS52]|uniref:FAD-dependent oxidoreductase n=1 Tax=Tessaracoccus sp. OS52 TaxID=2886691 RepID=UPI001D10763A|nr:FAD-binding protein [Tessaracoccus sp. OS52]MCC2593956.1 FAD-binding protein [Tessaracoccus sp. OS52]